MLLYVLPCMVGMGDLVYFRNLGGGNRDMPALAHETHSRLRPLGETR